MKIVFDMDGTIANLYKVDNWLAHLLAHSTTPYVEAEPIGDMAKLARLLNACKAKGIEIEIVSWLAPNAGKKYDDRVRYAKRKWLAQHIEVEWSAIHIIKYGTCKDKYRTATTDILFDDEIGNRKAWGGKAYEPQDIVKVLEALVA